MRKASACFGSKSCGRWTGGLLAVLILAFVVAGCAPAAATLAVQRTAVQIREAATLPPATSTLVPQLLPATGATPTPALVHLAEKAGFGLYLVDDKGMTLYEYVQDGTNTSTCYDKCAANWSPLLAVNAPLAGVGVKQSMLGTTTRKDGRTQVTYSGHPLYYYSKDQQPGDISGQGVGEMWFAVSTRGVGMIHAKVPGPATPQALTLFKPEALPSGPASLALSKTTELGQFVADGKGMTLYTYAKDMDNTSNCYGLCAAMWPPLLTSGMPVVGAGLDASLVSTTNRKDGSAQITYHGLPLYYSLDDQKPGDANGQWSGGEWYVLSPAGDKITAGKPTATPTP